MDKDKKKRSGSVSNRHDKAENSRGKTQQPGAPAKSNRQTGNHERNDSSGAERNTTKKGSNNI